MSLECLDAARRCARCEGERVTSDLSPHLEQIAAIHEVGAIVQTVPARFGGHIRGDGGAEGGQDQVQGGFCARASNEGETAAAHWG